MDRPILTTTQSESGIWIRDLVDGTSGMSVKVRRPLCGETSPVQSIEVYDTFSYGKVLLLAGSIVLTEKDEYIYSEMIVHPAMLMHPSPERVCVIGGGDGGALRQVLLHASAAAVTVVDIDEMVVQTVTSHFPLLAAGFSDPRVEVVIDDGHRYLEKTDAEFDVVIVDSYDPRGPVQSLSSEDFFHVVHQRLSDAGRAVFQTDSPMLREDALRHTLLNVTTIFAECRPYICALPTFPGGICSYVVCSKPTGGLDTFDTQRYEQIADQCSYYNRDVHTGAFLLPRHIKGMTR
jgi:spermidine synthase